MKTLRYLTAGESHGKALIGVIEGIPSGLSVSEGEIHSELKRRKLGYGRGARQKIESDQVEILSGVRLGLTLGSPISLMIRNQDWGAWQDIMSIEPQSNEVRRQVFVPRPGHADWIGGVKYAHSDLRNVLERASARETAMRVALGSVTRKLLRELGISVGSRVVSIGDEVDTSEVDSSMEDLNLISDASVVRCLSRDAEARMVDVIDRAKKSGDTLGGVFEVCVRGLPVGLGSYSQWDRRLEGRISQALMSLNAIKGVEFGLGFEVARKPGSQVHDEIFPGSKSHPIHFKTNFSGGIDGGMSTGQILRVRAAMKPLATLMKPLRSVDLRTGEPTSAHVERSDVCAVPAAAVIAESLLALALADAVLEKFGGDSLGEISERVHAWRGKQPVHEN